MPDKTSIWMNPGSDAADESLFAAFASEFGVELPAALKELYRIQNGGYLQDVEWPEYLLPLNAAAAVYERICSLQQWAEAGAMVSADDLDWVEEEYGDANRIFLLSSDGHTTFALDYNQCDDQGEPSIVYLDFECCSNERVAPSFAAWLKQLTQSDSECAVDWDEHQRYTELYRGSFTTDVTEHGHPELIEQVLCGDPRQGLLLFTRTTSQERVIEVSRVALPRGVDATLLDVRAYRPAPVNTWALHLQPVELNDIQWITSRRRQDDNWRNERSEGAPIYCLVEATERDDLDRLADEVRGAGLVHEPPPLDDSDLPQEFREHMQQMEQMAGAFLQHQRDMRDQPVPEIPAAAPLRGGDPAGMADDAITDELSQIILYYGGLVKNVRTPADARQLIDDFAPHTARYIELMRRLQVAADPLKGLALRQAEDVSRDAMNEVLNHSIEAYNLLEQHGRATMLEALRPESLDARGDEIAQQLIHTAGVVAELLQGVMQDKSIEPHLAALQAAVRDYADAEQRYADAMDSLADSEVGWIHQRRMGSHEFAALQQAWTTFRTKHRKLFKANRQLFDGLPDWL